MKGVIMAGGSGTRLRPLTCNIPKPMVPVGNRPMAEHIVDLLVEHGQNGITTYAGNSDSLAWGILQVLRDPGLAHHLIHTATRAVEEVYNWKMITKKTQETYEKVLADSKQDALLAAKK